MSSDPRFGIELYEEPDQRQVVDGVETTVVGHVWSPDAERIVAAADGRVSVIDPGGRNSTPLNASLAALTGFLDAFARFYSTDRPQVVAAPRPMTVDEARAKLRALHRGDEPTEEAPVVIVPRVVREATLRSELADIDPAALSAGSWWPRVLDGLAAGRY